MKGKIIKQSDSKKQLGMIVLSIILLCFILYGSSIKNKYALDDNYVTSVDSRSPNLKIQKGINGLYEIFTSHYIESDQQSFEYRPIVLATFAIEYHLFGRNPYISHFINVLIYAITCALLFLVLHKLLIKYHIVFPILITFLFASHPIHSEVVNNLKSRDELLSFFFGLLALYYFFKNSTSTSWLNIGLAAVFLLFGLMSKLTTVLFIALIPLTIYFYTDLKVKKITIYTFSLVVIYLVYTIIRNLLLADGLKLREYAFFENPLFYEENFWNRIPFAIYTLGYYVKLLVFPHPLSCYYGYDVIPYADWSFLFVWISLSFHIFIAAIAFLKIKQKNILSYGILIYFIGIFPFSNILTPVVGIIGERFAYFSSLGYSIVLAYLLIRVLKIDINNNKIEFKRFNPLLFLVVIIITVLFISKINSRNKEWEDKITLFRADVKQFPNSYFLNYFVAQTLFNQVSNIQNEVEKSKAISESKSHFNKAADLLKNGLKSNSNDYYSLSTLGTIYVNYLNDVNSATPWFEKSLSINPNYEVARFNSIFCLERKNMLDSAIVLYQKMINDSTDYLPVYYQLNDLFVFKKQYQNAVALNKKIIEKKPHDVKINVNLGNAFILCGDTVRGMKYFENAALIPPFDYILLQNVANIYYVIGDSLKGSQFEEKSKKAFKEAL